MSSTNTVLSYSNSNIAPSHLQESNAKTVRQLLEWKENLPEALRVDLQDKVAPYLPHVLLLQ